MIGSASRTGVVVIGRNEGERLRRCLRSVLAKASQVVYVDSGSTDGSVPMARDLGCQVVELDLQLPFTAARARNLGFERLHELMPDLQYVQFVDGDCEVVEGWLDTAACFLDGHPEVAVVCGRRREMHPDSSIYNLLCDIEWNTPVGETKSCGGDALMRAQAFAAAKGYRASLIAGEEPELCLRLRGSGWRIWRLNSEMTLHDAAMTRFHQWWKRAMRAGYACAEGAALHGASPERHRIRETRSIWFWGLGVPALSAASSLVAGPVGLGWLALYPPQVVRLAFQGSGSARENWWRALFLVLGKFPEVLGQLKFTRDRLFAVRSRLIEYK